MQQLFLLDSPVNENALPDIIKRASDVSVDPFTRARSGVTVTQLLCFRHTKMY
jgi:hypothetical protein